MGEVEDNSGGTSHQRGALQEDIGRHSGVLRRRCRGAGLGYRESLVAEAHPVCATRRDVRLNGSNAAESCHESPKSPRSRSQKEWASGGAGRWFLRHRMRVSASRYFAFLATGYTSRLLSSDIEPWEKSPRNEPCEKSLREEPWARRWTPARRACEIYGTEQGLPTPWTAATPPRSASTWMSENATGGAGGETGHYDFYRCMGTG